MPKTCKFKRKYVEQLCELHRNAKQITIPKVPHLSPPVFFSLLQSNQKSSGVAVFSPVFQVPRHGDVEQIHGLLVGPDHPGPPGHAGRAHAALQHLALATAEPGVAAVGVEGVHGPVVA